MMRYQTSTSIILVASSHFSGNNREIGPIQASHPLFCDKVFASSHKTEPSKQTWILRTHTNKGLIWS